MKYASELMADSRKQNHGWIWSPRTDFLNFSFPLLLVTPAIIYLAFTPTVTRDFSLVFYLLVATLLDKSHSYASIYRVYIDPRFRTERSLLIYLLPLSVLCIGLLLANWEYYYFWIFFAYANAFHVIRQQAGLIKLTNHKFKEASSTTRKLDSYAIHTLGFSAWIYAIAQYSEKELIRFWSGQSFKLPPSLAPFALSVFIATALIYSFTLWQAWRRETRFNYGKLHIWALSLLAFSALLISSQNIRIFALVILTTHSLPYIGLVFREGAQRWQASGGWQEKLFHSRPGLVFFLASLFFAAWFENGLWRELMRTGFHEVHWHTGWIQHSWGIANITAVLGTIQITHFFIDGFTWKARDVQALRT